MSNNPDTELLDKLSDTIDVLYVIVDKAPYVIDQLFRAINEIEEARRIIKINASDHPDPTDM